MKSLPPDDHFLNSNVSPSLFWQQPQSDPRSFSVSVLFHLCVVTGIAIALQSAGTTGPTVAVGSFAPIHLGHVVWFPVPHAGTGAHASGGSRHELLLASQGAPPVVARPLMGLTSSIPDDPPAVALRQTISDSAIPAIFTATIGDPQGIHGPPSDGPVDGRGVGRGPGDGIGVGNLGGWAPIEAGRHGVSVPRVIFDPDPEYTDDARKAKQQGNVLLSCVVGEDGLVRNAKVERPLGLGLDEKVVEAVTHWRFEPSRLNGKPVAVQILVEVNFHLY